MYELLEMLEELISKWENTPYTGDLTKAAKSVCAGELRQIIGNPTTGAVDGLHSCACGERIPLDEYRCLNCREWETAHH